MPRLTSQTPDAPFLLLSTVVTAVQQVSPTYRRFTFSGPQAELVADNGYDQRIKMLFPPEDGSLDDLPLTDDWYQVWRGLPDTRRHPMRTYTIREVRAEDREFDVDMAVHGRTGPASAWALDARIGDELLMNLPNRRHAHEHGGIDWKPPTEVGRVLLAGDETALPAIAGILRRLPGGTRGAAVVEVPHASDAAALAGSPEGVELTVLARGEAPPGARLVAAVDAVAARLTAPPSGAEERHPSATAAPALEDVDVDRGLLWEAPRGAEGGPLLDRAPLYAWLAGEAAVIKTLRRLLITSHGLDRRSVAFMGYWREGRSEGNL